MRRFSFLPILILIFTGPAYGSDLINLIRQGKTEEARRLMDSTASAAHRDGGRIFAQALLEPDGRKSLALLETAQKTGVDPTDAEYFFYQKALLYFAAGWPDSVLKTAAEYRTRWENGNFRTAMMKLEAAADENLSAPQAAERLRNLLARENPDSPDGADAKLNRARIMQQQKKYAEGKKALKSLIKSPYDNITVTALYLLSSSAAEQKKNDDALFYFNLLKEEFPEAVGLDDLTDRLSQFETSSADQSAEKITGTTYAVQVGVFSVRDNALMMAENMKKYNKSVDINEKVISGRKYFVVWVGKFLSSEQAMIFKARLEAAENETFQVIAR